METHFRPASLLAAARAVRGNEEVTKRLERSVVRPLEAVRGADAVSSNEVAPRSEDDLWQLAQDATAASKEDPAPEVLEAAAALQDLAIAGAPDDQSRAARLAWFRDVLGGLFPHVRLASNGPLLVVNVENMKNWLGEPIATRPLMALCRCGGSSMKPLCDGTHATNGFSDAKDPKRVPDRRETYAGEAVTIYDNRGICQHSGYCTDRLPTVFRAREEPFVAPSGGRMDEIIRAVRDCPSGALSYGVDGVEERDVVDWHDVRPPQIEVTRDGPYRLAGEIALLNPDGTPVARDEGSSLEHCALCRCGHAQNKPFCSGMHWYIDFKDPKLSDSPTVFEWAGGLPALTRMTRLFYEKYIPNDPLLAPLFANMSPEHPERVAKWLAEVFCGPTHYSEQYGGYPRMLSQHMGKEITEEKRQRWVTLLMQAAKDAQMPNDPEFASAFQAYIEWGSRLAVENSQSAANPPQHMPMPHWDWKTSAGAPGSRISALAPQEEKIVQPPLPGPNEPLGFEQNIKPLFREKDRKAMLFIFDLWSYEDVSANGAEILSKLEDGSMPCDGAWPQEQTDAFARWLQSGMLP